MKSASPSPPWRLLIARQARHALLTLRTIAGVSNSSVHSIQSPQNFTNIAWFSMLLRVIPHLLPIQVHGYFVSAKASRECLNGLSKETSLLRCSDAWPFGMVGVGETVTTPVTDEWPLTQPLNRLRAGPFHIACACNGVASEAAVEYRGGPPLKVPGSP